MRPAAGKSSAAGTKAAPRLHRRATLALLGLAAPPAFALVLWRVGSAKLVLTPSEVGIYRAHGTWHKMFATGGFVDNAPLIIWVLALLVVGLLALPYVWLAARSLPDGAAGLARPIGLLLVSWVVWWLVSLRILPFTRGAIALAAAAVAIGAAAIVARCRADLGAWVGARWRLLLLQETLFWSVFGLALVVRWSNPDLWHPTLGGEKPMDFAYLNAVAKSTHFPPFDPWFAGGQMNYYYFGFVLVAVLAKATAVVPAVAYNLAVPTLAASLAAAVFSATVALAARRARALSTAAGVGLLGVLFTVVLGNLAELRVVLRAVHHPIPTEWWYWNASRVVHHSPTEPGVITEFPAFTYLYADLHAHAMALPYAACALALSLALVRDGGPLLALGPALRFGLLALVVGALWPLNTWDVPTYALIAATAVAFSVARGRRLTLARSASALGSMLALLAAAYLLFLPFHLRYGGVFEGVALWHGSRTRVADYLTVHGLFLFAIVSGLLVDLWSSSSANALVRSGRLAIRSWDRFARLRVLRRALVTPTRTYRVAGRAVAAAALLIVALAATSQGVAALSAAVGTLALLAFVRGRPRQSADGDPLIRVAVLLVLLGLALTVAVEYFVARNIDIGRTNTVFKVYLQVWLLWAVAAAVLAASVYERLPRFPRRLRLAWRAAFVALGAVAALYPILATRAKIEDRLDTSASRTLDGTAFMRSAVLHVHNRAIPLAGDRAAIRWVLGNIDGSPVFAEVNTAPTLYGWGNRFAMFTGNPDVVGWDYHERQQRPSQSELVTRRVADVQEAYRTTDPDRAYGIFHRYGVSFFVVGALERAYYPRGQEKWDSAVGRLWTRVYRRDGVSIYRLGRT